MQRTIKARVTALALLTAVAAGCAKKEDTAAQAATRAEQAATRADGAVEPDALGGAARPAHPAVDGQPGYPEVLCSLGDGEKPFTTEHESQLNPRISLPGGP